MSNKINSFFLLLSAMIIALSSCKRGLLESTPRDVVTPAIALADFSGVQATLTSAYRKCYGFTYYGQRFITIGEALSDNAVLVNNNGRFGPETINSVFNHFQIWDGADGVELGSKPWGVINDCNTVIKFCTASKGGTEEEKALVVAEAKFLRALAYHDLARVYGYEPNRAGTTFNLAVPLRLEPTEVFSDAQGAVRATNVEIYTQIKKDLNEAIIGLPITTIAGTNVAAIGSRQRANKGVAMALLARVYLYEGNWALANTTATLAIANAGTAKLMTAAELTANYTVGASTTMNPESLLEFTIPTAPGVAFSTVDGGNTGLASMYGSYQALFPLGGSQELIASYESGDIRRTLWVLDPVLGAYKSLKWTAKHALSLGIDWVPVFRMSELYLIQAEANSELGNDALAVTSINTIRANRGLTPLFVANQTGQALKDAILRERRVEFAAEGHRWFDLKRKSIAISKPAKSITRGAVPIIQPDSRLILADIPQEEININPKLVQNPGYNQ